MKAKLSSSTRSRAASRPTRSRRPRRRTVARGIGQGGRCRHRLGPHRDRRRTHAPQESGSNGVDTGRGGTGGHGGPTGCRLISAPCRDRPGGNDLGQAFRMRIVQRTVRPASGADAVNVTGSFRKVVSRRCLVRRPGLRDARRGPDGTPARRRPRRHVDRARGGRRGTSARTSSGSHRDEPRAASRTTRWLAATRSTASPPSSTTCFTIWRARPTDGPHSDCLEWAVTATAKRPSRRSRTSADDSTRTMSLATHLQSDDPDQDPQTRQRPDGCPGGST